VLKATTSAGRSGAQADLKTDLVALDKQRSAIDAIWAAAKRATGATAAFPSPPTWEPPSS
jgi:hypothetical protein